MKKYLKTITLCLAIMLLWTNIVFAENKKKKLTIDARAAIAIDVNTGLILYEKNGKDLIAMASTTKIMTSLVAIEYGDLDKKIPISKRATAIKGSTVGYTAGEEISLRELLYGLMFKSGNDAAIAIAEGVAGSVDNFLVLMNEYALELGLRDTHFETPHGLDSNNHYTTAYDLALLTKKAKENPIFSEIVKSKIVESKDYNFSRSYQNINKLLYQVPEATGVKTGYTGNAGKCLVSSFDINGREIVVVTLNCIERWRESKKIFDYVKENYNYEVIAKENEVLDKLTLEDGRSINLICKNNIEVPKYKYSTYKVEICKPDYEFKQDITKDTIVGHLKLLKDGETILIENLYSDGELRESKNNSFLNKILKK